MDYYVRIALDEYNNFTEKINGKYTKLQDFMFTTRAFSKAERGAGPVMLGEIPSPFPKPWDLHCSPEEDTQGKSLMGILEVALDEYKYIQGRLSDPRVEDWLLMDTIFPTYFMVNLYLLFSLYLGPKLMERRQPFRLNTLLVIYNAMQTVISFTLFIQHLRSGWLFDYSFKCEPVDYSRSPKAMMMANVCWWYYISKITEFMDTIFFVLRKKYNQITLLHIFHHCVTPIESWMEVKFFAGGHGTFLNLVNNFVHTLMYTYYMLTAMGPQYQKYAQWKQHLTIVQLAQFILVTAYSAQVFIYDCGYPKTVAATLVVQSILFFLLFLDFYIKAFIRKKPKKA